MRAIFKQFAVFLQKAIVQKPEGKDKLMRYFIEHSYKGTNYHGWQAQPNANAIETELEKTFSLILKEKIEIIGSSRTDTGVHAKQQFAHFSFENSQNPLINNLDLLVFRVNALLPKDIAITQILPVKDDAHARFDAIYRKYIYRISQEKNPFMFEISYFFRQKMNLEKMNLAGKILTQHIDYQSFSRVRTGVRTFNCKIDFAFWEEKEGVLFFHIKADRFLRGMVRTIVGTMIEIGCNRLNLQDFEEIILSKNRNKAGRAVPPEGLTLEEVGYPSDIFLSNIH